MNSLAYDDSFLVESCEPDVAQHFYWKHHRTAGPINKQSHLESYIASYQGTVLGLVSLSRPCGRWDERWGNVVELSRICFTPSLNRRRFYTAPSTIVDVVCNGYVMRCENPVDHFVTYVHETESGLYLEHARFEKAGMVRHSDNSYGWNSRSGRNKSDLTNKKRYMRCEHHG